MEKIKVIQTKEDHVEWENIYHEVQLKYYTSYSKFINNSKFNMKKTNNPIKTCI